jgi:glutathione S-transferase
MKLRYSPTSPYVRKVAVLMHEAGLDPKIERIEVNPLNPDDVKSSPNPLGKIPCLITDDGQVLYDSPVILEYLDRLHAGPRLLAEDGPERWTALRRQALADGILESSVLVFVETMRKPERRSQGWIAHNKAAIDRAIDSLETEAEDLGKAVDIGRIAVAVALAFVDQQFPEENWRAGHPKLAAWFDAFNQRPSMRATVLTEAKR